MKKIMYITTRNHAYGSVTRQYIRGLASLSEHGQIILEGRCLLEQTLQLWDSCSQKKPAASAAQGILYVELVY